MNPLDAHAGAAVSPAATPEPSPLAAVSAPEVPAELVRAEAKRFCTAVPLAQSEGAAPVERFHAAARNAAATVYLASEKLGVNFVPELPAGISAREFNSRVYLAAALRAQEVPKASHRLEVRSTAVRSACRSVADAVGITGDLDELIKSPLPEDVQLLLRSAEIRSANHLGAMYFKAAQSWEKPVREPTALPPPPAALPPDIEGVTVSEETYRGWFKPDSIADLKAATPLEWLSEALRRTVATLYILEKPVEDRKLPPGLTASELKLRSFLLAYATLPTTNDAAALLGCTPVHVSVKGGGIRTAMGITSRHEIPDLTALPLELRRAIADAKVIRLDFCAAKVEESYPAPAPVRPRSKFVLKFGSQARTSGEEAHDGDGAAKPAKEPPKRISLGKSPDTAELRSWFTTAKLADSPGETPEQRAQAAIRNAVATMLLGQRSQFISPPTFEREDFLRRMLLGTAIAHEDRKRVAGIFSFGESFIENHLNALAAKLGVGKMEDLIAQDRLDPRVKAAIPYLVFQDMDRWRSTVTF